MRISKFIAIPLIGVLTVLGACGSTAATTPPATTPPATTQPETTPPATTPPATTQPATTPPATTQPTTTPPAATPPPTTPPANPTGPAKFVTSDMKISETHLQPADTATVSVVVTNTGGETGTYPVVLKVNGATFATKSVTLAGGKSETVSFGVKPEGEKELKATITIDALSVEALWEIH